MIDVRVLDIRPHPDQTTNNGTWAVRFEVSRDGARRTFWRWYMTLRTKDRSRSRGA